VAGDQTIAGDVVLGACPESTIGLSLPRPLSERIDRLVAAAEFAGERTTRKEILAALVLEAPLDGLELSAMIRRLRNAAVRDAIPTDSTGSIQLVRHRPGPRPRVGPLGNQDDATGQAAAPVVGRPGGGGPATRARPSASRTSQ
jgi:hypothetical protein